VKALVVWEVLLLVELVVMMVRHNLKYMVEVVLVPKVLNHQRVVVLEMVL
jgi:hypothetical protein